MQRFFECTWPKRYALLAFRHTAVGKTSRCCCCIVTAFHYANRPLSIRTSIFFFCAAGRFCVNFILRSTNAQNEVIWPFWDYLKVQLSMENMLYGSCSCFWSPPLVWWWPLVIWRRTCRHKKKKNHPKLPSGGFKAMAKLGMADTAFPVASDQWTAPPLPTHPPFPFARISWLSWCRRIVGLISITSNGF